MADGLPALVESLLWEGYALFPYTPGATKNATPTPFGIAYPPAYAQSLDTAYDHLELRIALDAPADAVVHAEVALLASTGERYHGEAHRLRMPGVMVGALAHAAAEKAVPVAAARGPALEAGITLSARERGARTYEVILRVENRTVVSSGLDRAGALRRSLISTHPILTVEGGRFISPLEQPCGSVNTFPVLARDDDSAVVGAAIVLPDHPQIAPESQGGLFDSTEIEEALLLHTRVLTGAERAQIAGDDPAVRAMLARADAVDARDILALHGRVTVSDPAPEPAPRPRETPAPPSPPEDLPDPRAGDESAEVGGRRLRRGGTVVIRPGPGADVQARMLDGRSATLERIFTAYDGRVHLGVTIDDDPGQQLMRETGRYLYFFAEEVEVIDA